MPHPHEDKDGNRTGNMSKEMEAYIDNQMAERWNMPSLKKKLGEGIKPGGLGWKNPFNTKKENVSMTEHDMQAFIFPAAFDNESFVGDFYDEF